MQKLLRTFHFCGLGWIQVGSRDCDVRRPGSWAQITDACGIIDRGVSTIWGTIVFTFTIDFSTP